MNKKGQFSSIIINTVLATLLVISMFAMLYAFALENGSSSVLDDSKLSALNHSLYNQLDIVQAKTTNSTNALKDEASGGYLITTGEIYFTSVISTVINFMTIGIAIPTLVSVTLGDVLGVSPIVTGTLLAVLGFVFILAIWRIWKSGE